MSKNSEFFEKVGTDVRERTPSPDSFLNKAPHPEHSGYGGALYAAPPEATVIDLESDQKWSTDGRVFWSSSPTRESIPAGFYSPGFNPRTGVFLEKKPIATDNLLELPDEATRIILNEFRDFWSKEAAFRARGLLFKRGYLLWGPPASGKSSAVQLLTKRVVTDMGGVVVSISAPEIAIDGLKMLRLIEPKRPVLCVLEDLDALVATHGEAEYLKLLDGDAQIDNVSYVATTNYPERLDLRFVDRPSRFDTVKYVGMPSPECRRIYLKAKEPSLTEDELDLWVARSDGFSVAHLKEMIVAVRCFGQRLDDVIERLEDMGARRPTSGDSPRKYPVGILPKHKNGTIHSV